MRRFASTALAAGLAVGGLLGFSSPAGAIIIVGGKPQIALPTGPGYSLAATTGNPGLPNPLILVGLNPQPLPPKPADLVQLDLANAQSPQINNDGNSERFGVSFYMQSSTALSFHVDPNPDFNFVVFELMDDLDNVYSVTFSISGPGGPVEDLDWVMLNPQPLPPKDFVGFSATFADPSTLQFEMSINGSPASFSLVPEPGSAVVLGLMGLGVLGRGVRRRR